jgi:hypothetical protein
MDILLTLRELIANLATLAYELLALAWHYVLFIVWIAWWLWGVNWKRGWAFLGQGAWAPLVLLMLVSALVWSRIAPGRCDCLGIVSVPNFLWQLGYVSMLVAIALFCGWLQGVFHWSPAEINLEPPLHGHGGHDHGHGSDELDHGRSEPEGKGPVPHH